MIPNSKCFVNPFVLLLIFFYLQMSSAVIYNLNDEDYELMPPVVTLDPFETCLQQPGGRYCTAYATFVADEPSPLLKQMQEYSAHTATHFNHTRALFGTCLTRKCMNFYDNSIKDQRHVLEACLNQSVWEQYKLKVKVDEKVLCNEYNEKRLNVGAVDIAVAGVLLALVVSNAVGSLYDVFCNTQGDGLVAQFLLCFSIPRNWNRLVAPPGSADPRLDSFKGIYGIRAILMTLVIAAHAMLPAVVVCANPKFVEDEYEEIPIHIMLNGSATMQVFLFLSAFLLTYNSQLYAEKHCISWRNLPEALLRRWLRLTPSYAVVLAVTATWFRYTGFGPLWDTIVVSEAEDCRHHWWKHLLYINNHDDDSLCMPQAWYLAADTQLYCLGLIIIVFCQTPRSRKVVVPIVFVIGLIIPGLLTYYRDLDAMLIVSPSTAVGFFRSDRTFNEVYTRGYTNIAGYILGMACGYLVYHLQKNNFDGSKYRKWRPLYWFLIPFAICTILTGKQFYGEGPRAGLYYRVLVAVFIKPIFGLICSLFIVGMILKIDKVHCGLLEWRGWTSLGRMSYSAYLLHMAFIKVTTAAETQPLHFVYRRVAETILLNIVVTYIAAAMFWITVEAPLGQLVKTCLEPRPASGAGAKPDTGTTTEKIDPKL